MGRFDELLNLAGNFVEKQKGMWDHNAWNNFLSDVQAKGLKLNQDIEGKLGYTLETMKQYYSVVTNSHEINDTLDDIWAKTSEFIKKTNGVWDHAGWEKYISDIRAKGHSITDETIGYIGAVLEASKQLYMNNPEFEKKSEPKVIAPYKTPKTKKAVTPKEAEIDIPKPAIKAKSKTSSDSAMSASSHKASDSKKK
ncbi:MAG: hypothetical protein HQK91_01410 [Nitrospirae bacterium]|nr:hypothetical protein [Nitrospirota bacterium]